MTIILASSSLGRKRLIDSLKIPYKIIPPDVDEEKIIGINPYETLRLRAIAKAEFVFKQIIRNSKPSTKRYALYPCLPADRLDAKRSIILSADSGVILNNKLIGKPKNLQQAKYYLSQLSGKTHIFASHVYAIKILSRISKGKLIRQNRGTSKMARSDSPGVKVHESHQKIITTSGVAGWNENGSHDSPDVKNYNIILDEYSQTSVTFRKLTSQDTSFYLSKTDYKKFAGGYALVSAQTFITKVEGSISNVIGLPLELIIPIFQSPLG